MLRPTPEVLSLMKPTERLGFRVGDFFARHLAWLANAWILGFVAIFAWLAMGRRRRTFHIDKLTTSKRSQAILVANHRSFFDFFVLSAVIRWARRCPRRALFPVRANFFYDTLIGTAINLFMSAMSMFPPIFRDPRRSALNKFAIARTVSELEEPGTLIGVHPEGTRSKGDDPYKFLPAQPGVGKVILEAPDEVQVFPVFILGVSNKLGSEIWKNLFAPSKHPVWVIFGDPIDFSDLRAEGSRPSTQKRASNRCLEVIGELAAEQRERAKAAGQSSQSSSSLQATA